MKEKFSGVLRVDPETTGSGKVNAEFDDPVVGTTVFEMRRDAVDHFQTAMEVA